MRVFKVKLEILYLIIVTCAKYQDALLLKHPNTLNNLTNILRKYFKKNFQF